TVSTTHTFEGIDTFGDYFIRVIDANGCEYLENPVRMPAQPFLSISSETTALDCPTGATLEITASGGNGDYDFEIFGSGTAPDFEVPGPGANEETATFSGLNPGQTYIFQVTDNVSNCVAYFEETTTAISAMTLSV